MKLLLFKFRYLRRERSENATGRVVRRLWPRAILRGQIYHLDVYAKETRSYLARDADLDSPVLLLPKTKSSSTVASLMSAICL